MNSPSHCAPWLKILPLSPERCRKLRTRAIFECCKWDPQVEDVETLAPMAVVLRESAWEELQLAAEALSGETLALERELARRPSLHRKLALPPQIRRALAGLSTGEPLCRHLRVMRFDFHPTAEGWRVSEVNTDVPGGYNEASGWTSIVAEDIEDCAPVADPAGCLALEIQNQIPKKGTVALVHATAYSDDRQVMAFLAKRFEEVGIEPVLVAPDHIFWHEGRAIIKTSWFTGPADFVFRFFPAEWLPNLGRKTCWAAFFGHTRTPQCNPATALLTQSKRWPLVCDQLGLDLPAWKRFMPETRDPREVDWKRGDQWVLKPALGRVGELVGMTGVTESREWKAIRRAVRWGARHWVAQRRFEPVPIMLDDVAWHICFGVYTINGRAAGIYGRVADRPLINHLARDVAVLVEQPRCIQYENLRAV